MQTNLTLFSVSNLEPENLTHLSMTSLSLVMLLLLYVSVHACTARFPSFVKKDTTHKELDKVKLLETLTSVKVYKVDENQPQQQKIANNEIKICESCSSVSSTLKILEAASGTPFQMDSPSSLVAQDGRRHGRSMLGPIEETEVTNTSDTTEDIVEMDYAQPHRKPPIHNEKP